MDEKDCKGWLPKFELEEWEGTWYRLQGIVLPWPEAVVALVEIGFTEDEAVEYLDLLDWEDNLL